MSDGSMFNSKGELIPVTKEAMSEIILLREQNDTLRGAVERMSAKLQDYYTNEYIVHELINPE